MATIIDELVTKISLDPSNFEKGSASVQTNLKKTQDAAARTAKEMQADGARASEFFSAIKVQALGLIGVLAGSAGLGAVVASSAKSMADLGREAKNIGVSAQALAAFQNVIVQNGGSVEGATNALQGYATTIQKIKTGADDGGKLLGFLSLIGETNLNASPLDAVQKFLEWSEKHKDNPLLVNQVGTGIFGDQGTVNALQQLTSVREFVKAMQAAYADVPTPKMIADATALQKSFEALKQAIGGVGNAITEDLAGPLTQLDNWVVKQIHGHEEGAKELGETGVAAGIYASLRGSLMALRKGLSLIGNKPGVAAIDGLLGAVDMIPAAALAGLFVQQNQEALGSSADQQREALKKAIEQSRGGAKPTPLPGQEAGKANEAIDYFVSQGWTAEQAAGIVGNLMQESTLNPLAGAGTAHQGIGQWEKSRQADIEQHFGKPLMSMTRMEQYAAVQWELTAGKYKAVGDKLRTQTDAYDAASLIDREYEKPGGYWYEDILRGMYATRALSIHNHPSAPKIAFPSPAGSGPHAANTNAQTTVNIASVNVNTPATDAKRIGRDIRTALNDALITQGNRGLA